jgi:hypothetical protein
MKLVKPFSQLWASILISLIFISGCSAKSLVLQAPTNKLVTGPHTIGADWQTIKFEEALETSPHIQRIEFLLNNQAYQEVDNIQKNDFNLISSGYKQLQTDELVSLEVIFIDSAGREFQATVNSVGYREINDRNYNFLAYGPNSNKGKLYFPKESVFIAVKVKSNIKIQVEHLYWVAPYYSRHPFDTWEDINTSQIVSFE